MSEEETSEAPAEDRTYTAEEYQAVKDESIARRHELKEYKDAFGQFSDDEKGALLGLVGELAQDPGAGALKMRDIAYNISQDPTVQADFLADAPWLAPAASPGEQEGRRLEQTMQPGGDITDTTIEDRMDKKFEEFLHAQRVEAYTQEIYKVGAELGYNRVGDDGNVTPQWDILMTVANRYREGAGSAGEAVRKAHEWLQENGPGAAQKKAEHPRTAAVSPAPTAADGSTEAPQFADLAAVNEFLMQRVRSADQ